MLGSRFSFLTLSALLVSVLVTSSRADTLATINVDVLKQGNAENQGIRLSPVKVQQVNLDNINFRVDSDLFCPGPGTTSGQVKISVPANSCGFTQGDQTITEGGTLTKLVGPANSGVTSFNITVNYSDADCGENTGPATQTLCVDCNGGLKKHCTASVPGKGAVCTPDVTFCDCAALGGVWDDVCVPTVSEWGLAVMALLVLTAATVVIMRRRAAATT
ncbi:MAG: IPTL-CTERM sorting domain-containing protein [Planctomycetota bacterium]